MIKIYPRNIFAICMEKNQYNFERFEKDPIFNKLKNFMISPEELKIYANKQEIDFVFSVELKDENAMSKYNKYLFIPENQVVLSVEESFSYFNQYINKISLDWQKVNKVNKVNKGEKKLKKFLKLFKNAFQDIFLKKEFDPVFKVKDKLITLLNNFLIEIPEELIILFESLDLIKKIKDNDDFINLIISPNRIEKIMEEKKMQYKSVYYGNYDEICSFIQKQNNLNFENNNIQTNIKIIPSYIKTRLLYDYLDDERKEKLDNILLIFENNITTLIENFEGAKKLEFFQNILFIFQNLKKSIQKDFEYNENQMQSNLFCINDLIISYENIIEIQKNEEFQYLIIKPKELQEKAQNYGINQEQFFQMFEYIKNDDILGKMEKVTKSNFNKRISIIRNYLENNLNYFITKKKMNEKNIIFNINFLKENSNFDNLIYINFNTAIQLLNYIPNLFKKKDFNKILKILNIIKDFICQLFSENDKDISEDYKDKIFAKIPKFIDLIKSFQILQEINKIEQQEKNKIFKEKMEYYINNDILDKIKKRLYLDPNSIRDFNADGEIYIDENYNTQQEKIDDYYIYNNQNGAQKSIGIIEKMKVKIAKNPNIKIMKRFFKKNKIDLQLKILKSYRLYIIKKNMDSDYDQTLINNSKFFPLDINKIDSIPDLLEKDSFLKIATILEELIENIKMICLKNEENIEGLKDLINLASYFTKISKIVRHINEKNIKQNIDKLIIQPKNLLDFSMDLGLSIFNKFNSQYENDEDIFKRLNPQIKYDFKERINLLKMYIFNQLNEENKNIDNNFRSQLDNLLNIQQLIIDHNFKEIYENFSQISLIISNLFPNPTNDTLQKFNIFYDLKFSFFIIQQIDENLNANELENSKDELQQKQEDLKINELQNANSEPYILENANQDAKNHHINQNKLIPLDQFDGLKKMDSDDQRRQNNNDQQKDHKNSQQNPKQKSQIKNNTQLRITIIIIIFLTLNIILICVFLFIIYNYHNAILS